MHLDPASDTPIFLQIAAAIRADIAAGVFRPGDTVPSIRAAALDLLVNPNTVARAYAQLEREGLLIPSRGVGMLVARRTESPARAATVAAIHASFSSAIHSGRRAALDRKSIDAVYRRAWSESQEARA